MLPAHGPTGVRIRYDKQGQGLHKALVDLATSSVAPIIKLMSAPESDIKCDIMQCPLWAKSDMASLEQGP